MCRDGIPPKNCAAVFEPVPKACYEMFLYNSIGGVGSLSQGFQAKKMEFDRLVLSPPPSSSIGVGIFVFNFLAGVDLKNIGSRAANVSEFLSAFSWKRCPPKTKINMFHGLLNLVKFNPSLTCWQYIASNVSVCMCVLVSARGLKLTCKIRLTVWKRFFRHFMLLQHRHSLLHPTPRRTRLTWADHTQNFLTFAWFLGGPCSRDLPNQVAFKRWDACKHDKMDDAGGNTARRILGREMHALLLPGRECCCGATLWFPALGPCLRFCWHGCRHWPRRIVFYPSAASLSTYPDEITCHNPVPSWTWPLGFQHGRDPN